jgi:SNF2 family DNA or RNA helicase
MPLVIARLDKLSRDEELQQKLDQTEWDLIVFDEAHKLSASVFGNEIKYTKRYRLGQRLSGLTRHLLLLSATPHNGKEEDFQLFMALVDEDRFEGRYREGVHNSDASDLMRRLVKEHLLKFDGTPLFPERRAYTPTYQLSDDEAALYRAVTDYVREQFDRADKVLQEGKKGTVGFALTILQRRLASSPEAIYQSLKRRRERLESRLREEKLLRRGAEVRAGRDAALQFVESLPDIDEEIVDDLEDAPDDEQQQTSEQMLDLATAARTIAELETEITILRDLERMAERVRNGGTDRKWAELSSLLQDNAEMFDAQGHRRKLVIFTEHRDTLNYLAERIRVLLGRPEAVVTIHGGLRREDRRTAQDTFVQDKDVQVLIATDAAGEGINLQRAHLMVNYDLPWNPARLEQRFGRIHRIGQTEVCHLWNLVATETREGDVYYRLLKKIEEQRRVLGDGVFDILGRLFQERRLRDLLIEAVRYGDRPEVRANLFRAVDNLADREHCRQLLEDRALARDSMDVTQVQRIRQDFERMQARRLQPHFIAAFFRSAFEKLGGAIYERESNRYEITRIPEAIRSRSVGRGRVLPRYERVTFHKEFIRAPGKPEADFLCPGHPLLDAVIDLTLERYRGLLRRGAVLVDKNDSGKEIRLLFYIEHSIQDGKVEPSGERRIISRQMQFVEIDSQGNTRSGGPAPFLDYEPLAESEREQIGSFLAADWLKGDLESQALSYAVQHLVPEHFGEVRQRREETVERTIAAVKDRLTKEIAYWDHRAEELKAQEQAGRRNARLNSEMARRRADELQGRLQRRLEGLEQERRLSPLPPVVLGGAVIIPTGLLAVVDSEAGEDETEMLFARHRDLIEQTAMQAVMAEERRRGFTPRDVSKAKVGWDVESEIPAEPGRLRFIEVKGRITRAKTVTVSKNEILAALNKPNDFFLAIVEVSVKAGNAPGATAVAVSYVRQPFQREPDFGVTSVNYDLESLVTRAQI